MENERQYLNGNRSFAAFFFLSLITCGIYGLVFMASLIQDLNVACGYKEMDERDKSPGIGTLILLSLVTLGIYMIIWYYKQGNRMKKVGDLYEIPMEESGSSYLLWMIAGALLFGVGPVVASFLFIGNANRLCRAYNYWLDAEKKSSYAEPEQISETTSGIMNNNPQNHLPGYQVMPQPQVIDTGTVGIMPFGSMKCVAGVYMGAELRIENGETLVIGRNASLCQLVLPNKDISKKHLTISYSMLNGCYDVTDYSTFGTFMNKSIKLEKNVSTKCPAGTLLTLASGGNAFLLQ